MRHFIALFVTFMAAASPVISQASPTIFLTRHYEKSSEPTDPPLTAAGHKRAFALADTLKDQAIGAIYTTEYQRTIQTAIPLSLAVEVPLTYYQPDQPEQLISQLKAQQKNTLIVGHSNTIPELIHLLGGPDFTISEQEYGTLFKLTIDANQTVVEIEQVNPQQNVHND